ncbi:hypothetical protein CAEBREN_12401 [Caenorhabditis brenneri]|uniref:Peptidase S72 domain-containing protein n=1 Tax=Caenorhabditis brenneri TaxID=135651 RepID=G0NCB1_CAEBE|nr:hypothetical protein CAEBREN_12401 [Caenorhabditis brenneri]
MKYRLLALLLLPLFILHSRPTTATPDSPDFKTFPFQFYYPGTNMMTLDDVVSLAELALSQNMTVMMKMVSTVAPVSFTIKNCNEVILERDIPSRNSEIYFDEFWMTHLGESGKRRCSREEYDFTLQIKASQATSGFFRFETLAQFPTMKSMDFDSGIQVHQTKWEQKKYPMNLQDQIARVKINPFTKSLVILPAFDTNKFAIQFRKCDLNPMMLSLIEPSPAILNSELLYHLELLSHLKCREDSHDGRIDVTLFSEDQPLNGTLVFHVADHTGVLDYLKFGSLLLIVFGFILTVCIAIGHCFAWCKEGKRAKYIKKNPLLMRPLPPIPEQEEIEMTVFVPKFVTLSYDSRDYSEGSTEHIYESID